MKKYFLKIAAVSLFLVINSFVYAVEADLRDIDFSIRLFDRRIYHVTGDPIYVQVTIQNNSPAPFRFKLADDRAFSMNIDTRTMTNRPLPQSDALIRARTTNRQVFFREITIESRESFSFIEDLRDFVRFEQPGSFRVRAFIYPELIRSPNVVPLESNSIFISLRPDTVIGADGIPIEMDIETGAALVRQQLPPDEVVSFTIIARQQSQWERFFLYLDLESMLLRDPLQNRRFRSESEAGRRRMVLEYRQNLQRGVVDEAIVLIPTSFEILRTNHSTTEGWVDVLKRFRHPNFTELRRYRYYLERQDRYWVIVNFTVEGLGTEAN